MLYKLPLELIFIINEYLDDVDIVKLKCLMPKLFYSSEKFKLKGKYKYNKFPTNKYLVDKFLFYR